MHTYGCFMLRFDRKQQNSVQQLSFNKNKLLKKKRCGVYMCMYIYTHTQWNTSQPLKKNKTMPVVTICMNLEIILLSEVSYIEKEKYIIYLWNLKKRYKITFL